MTDYYADTSALVTNETLIATDLSPLVFLCADDRLLAAAATEGLTTANPNDHA